jgi:polar amino acid transport system substrate-binding protein
VLRFAFAAVLLLALTGCPPSGTPSVARDALDDVKARGKLIVASDIGYDPFEVAAPDGTFQGFDVDLVKEVAADLGVTPEIRNTKWTNIFSDLQTGKVDAIFSGLSITDERRKTLAFSDSYYDVGQVIVKRKGDGRIKSFRDLDDPKMRVATQGGTTGEIAIGRFMPKAQLMRFERADEACLTVIQEKADAVVFDHPFLIKYATLQTTELEGLWEPFTDEPFGAGMRMDSQKLVDAVNQTIARLRQSGKLAEMQKRWFPARPQ